LAPGISIKNIIQGVNGEYEVSAFVKVVIEIEKGSTIVPENNITGPGRKAEDREQRKV